MNLLQQFKEHISKRQLFTEAGPLLLAVSGGLDSVVLCELCYQAGFRFSMAHCNFQLRGAESDRDENFVRQLALKYNAPIFVSKFDTEKYAATHKLSTQEAARVLRYEWFADLLETKAVKEDTSAGFLLTAHHADDDMETLLMHFFRGTGLHGLSGIPEMNGSIRRPLLPFSREALQVFANEQGLEWVEDSSNASSAYTRNYFRNELIPALEKVFPQVKNNLRDNLVRFKETEQLYQLAVAQIKKKLIRQKGVEQHIPVKQLLGYKSRALIFEIIRVFGFTEKQIDEVIKLGKSDSGRYIDAPTGQYRLIRHRHWFIMSPVQAEESLNIMIEKENPEIRFALGVLHLKSKMNKSDAATTTTDTQQVLLDAKDIQYPLLLRKWKTGDYFYPLGMKKKKKIARFLIDAKLSKSAKEQVWVLESNQRIIWLVGHRIDERFKITSRTKELLSLQLES